MQPQAPQPGASLPPPPPRFAAAPPPAREAALPPATPPEGAAPAAHTIVRFPGFGARPFADTPEAQLVFFGRGADTDRLVHSVLASRLTVLYGMSGAGKTSLLKAGAFPRLLEEGLFPVLVRIGPGESPAALVVTAVRGACERAGLELAAGAETGLWEFFKTSVIWRGEAVLTPLLILDQFEEFFRSDPKLRLPAEYRTAFAAEIGAITSGVAPERLKEGRGTEVRRLDPNPPDVRVVISLREEDFGALQDLSPLIPGLFHERVRLAPLTRDQALEAIRGPASMEAPPAQLEGARFASPPFDFDPGATETLLRFLEGSSGEIEGWELQQVGSYLERKVVPGRSPPGGAKLVLDREDVLRRGTLGTALDEFYLDSLSALPRKQGRRARALCEEALLTRGGNRVMLEASQIKSEYGVTEETLAKLDDLHVVRHAWRIGGLHYELTHDRLAEAVARNRKWRIPRKYRLVVPVVAVGLVAVLAAALFAWTRSREMRIARGHAEQLARGVLEEGFLEQMRELGRTELLEELQARVDTFLAATSSETVWDRRNQGVARRNAGEIALGRGELAKAKQRFEESGKIFEDLRRQEPERAEWTLELARSNERYAVALRAEGHVSGALATDRRAVDLSGQVTNAAAGTELELPARLVAAEAHLHAGDHLLTEESLAEAEAAYEQALQLGRSVQAQAATPNLARQALAVIVQGHIGRGDALEKEDRRVESLAAYREGLAAATQLLQAAPLSAKARTWQAVVLNRLANASEVEESPNQVAEHHKRVLRRAEELSRWDPLSAVSRRDRAYSTMLFAKANAALEKRDEADQGFKKAIEEMQALVGQDPDNAEWKTDLAEILVASASTDGRAPKDELALRRQADGLLEQVTSLDDGNAADRLTRGWNLLLLGQSTEVEEPEQLARLRTAATLAAEVLRARPQSVEASQVLVWALQLQLSRLGEGDDAVRLETQVAEVLAAARTEHPDNPYLTSMDAYRRLRHARAAETERPAEARADLDGAIALYQAAVKALPRDPTARDNLAQAELDRARVLERLGEHRSAAQSCEEAARQWAEAAKARPSYAPYQQRLHRACLQRSEVLHAMGDEGGAAREQQRAEAAVRRSIELAPGEPAYRRDLISVWKKIGEARSEAGDHPGAAAACKRRASAAMEAAKTTGDRARFLDAAWSAYWSEGDELAAAKDPAGALRAYADAGSAASSAVALTPRVAERHNQLHIARYSRGQYLAERGDHAAAVEDLEAARREIERAIALDADEPVYRGNQARGLLALGGEREALGDAKRALQAYRGQADAARALLRSKPGDEEGLRLLVMGEYHTGQLLAAAGDTDGARRAYLAALEATREAVKTDPARKEDVETLERLVEGK